MGENADKKFNSLRKSLDSQRRKRDELNLKVKELGGSLKLLRERREVLNREVQSLKEARNSRQGQIKALAEEAKKLGAELGKENSDGLTTSQLKALLEKLEFDYQTKPTSFQNEKKAVEAIEKTKKRLEKRKVYELKLNEFKDVERKIRAIKGEAQVAHAKMLALVKQSDEVHEQIRGIQKQFFLVRKAADDTHKDAVKSSEQLRAARNELQAEKQAEIRKVFSTRAELERRKEAEIRAKAEVIEREIKGKKKFDLRDLQILQHLGRDAPFIKVTQPEKELKASGKRRRRSSA